MSDSVYNKNNLFIDINNTYDLINFGDVNIIESVLNTFCNEMDELKQNNTIISNSLITSDKTTKGNRILRTKGIIITDSYNNVVFPIKYPKLDTHRFDLLELMINFKEIYGNYKLDFLPWHFIIEFIKTSYFIFNTRPIDQKFPLSTHEALDVIDKNSINLNEKSKQFFKIKPFEFEDAIHVLIIGDSNRDVYTKKIYQLISYNCIGPVLRQLGYSKELWNRVWFLNIGKKFNMSAMESYIQS